jgi:N,N'-diacetyllegionaminate synthase
MTYVIAELGINHNGNFNNAINLIKLAKKAGANAVKLQTFEPEEIMIKSLGMAPYQKNNNKKNIFEIISSCRLSHEDHFKIKKICKKLSIDLLSSPFDLISAKFLIEELKVSKIKIPSGEITNYPLIEFLAKKNIPIIMSTGMANIKEIGDALEIFKKNKHDNKKILLHCTTSYPTKIENVNLNAIKTLQKKFKLEVGYSDHTNGYMAAVGALCLGAKVIEKHITLNNNLKGPDHKASLNPKDFINFCKKIRETEVMLGDGKKRINIAEAKNIRFARKSIVAKKNIAKGEKFNVNNITTKRAGVIKSAMQWKKIIGKKSIKKYKKDDLI